MAINFPDNPTVGQTFTASNRTWIYNGSSWVGDYSSTGNADTLDGIDSIQFLRSDADTTLLNGNLTLNKNLSDTILNLETDASGAYDPIINMGSGQNDINVEGFQIWYSNNVGDVHLSTTYNNAASAIRFHTATGTNKVATGVNERLTITGSGNIGIGTTNPVELLDVEGDVQFGAMLNFRSVSNLAGIGFNRKVSNGVIYNSNIPAYQLQNNEGNWEIQHYNSSGGFIGYSFFVQGSTGNVGINNSNPQATLDVAGFSLAQSGFKIGTTSAWKIRPNNANTHLAFEYSTSSGLNDANIKHVMTGDRLGINTSSPESALHVFGSPKVESGIYKAVANATTNNANGFTVYDDIETGYLSYRVTNSQSTRGWGWELTTNEANSTEVSAVPYFRVDYNYKTIQIIAQTESTLSANAPAGSIAYVTDGDGQLFLKNSVGWSSFTLPPIGSAVTNPAPSATAIMTAGASTGDGYYYIKPHNTSPIYYVYCDMTTDGGGWMMMINARPNNGNQYTDNNDFGLSTVNGVTNVPEYNKSTTSMFGTTKIADFFKMTGFKYGRMTPGPGVSITAPYTGLYQRIGTGTTNFWEGSGNDCSLRSTLASRNAWVLTQFQNWSEAQSATNSQTGTYTGSEHDYPTTYDNAYQNFWKGDQDGIRFSSTFRGENYSSIGQNTSPGYWWIKSDQ